MNSSSGDEANMGSVTSRYGFIVVATDAGTYKIQGLRTSPYFAPEPYWAGRWVEGRFEQWEFQSALLANWRCMRMNARA